MRLFLFIFSTLLCRVYFSQVDSLKQKEIIPESHQTISREQHRTIDSLTVQLKKDSAHIYRFQKLRPYLSIDNRNSFINNKPVNFKGIQFGVILHENQILALGFYAMSQNSKKPVSTKEGTIPAKKTISLNMGLSKKNILNWICRLK